MKKKKKNPPKVAAHEEAQLLSNVEEKNIELWTTHLTRTGYLEIFAIVIETAEKNSLGKRQAQLLEYPAYSSTCH